MYPPLGLALANPGDLRPLPNGQTWRGQTAVVDGFCEFAGPWGLRALGRTLESYVLVGWNTPALIAAHYAPAGDGANDPDAYANGLAAPLGIAATDPVNVADAPSLAAVMAAIIRTEIGSAPSGSPWYSVAELTEAAAVALGGPVPGTWPAA